MRAQGYGPLERYFFAGDENMDQTIDTDSVVDVSICDLDISQLASDDHGYKKSQDWPRTRTHIYVLGTTNYDGLRVIETVATNTIDIIAPFVAETDLAGTEELFPGLKFNEPWFFCGFHLHQSADGGASENFTITLDAAAGSYFDTVLYTIPMNGVTDYVEILSPDEMIPLAGNDLIKCAYANTNDKTWGLTLFARRAA